MVFHPLHFPDNSSSTVVAAPSCAIHRLCLSSSSRSGKRLWNCCAPIAEIPITDSFLERGISNVSMIRYTPSSRPSRELTYRIACAPLNGSSLISCFFRPSRMSSMNSSWILAVMMIVVLNDSSNQRRLINVRLTNTRSMIYNSPLLAACRLGDGMRRCASHAVFFVYRYGGGSGWFRDVGCRPRPIIDAGGRVANPPCRPPARAGCAHRRPPRVFAATPRRRR